MQEDVYQDDGLNLYAYCGNNPVVYYDPSGYEGYYFRGTTEGFGGRRDYDFTFTSSDPSVAIAYAVRGQTETGLPGIVYIATDSDLTGIGIETWYGSIPTDKEVYVNMPPNEFANAASMSLDVSQARDILKDTTGVEVSSCIRGEDGLSAELGRNYDKLGEDDINKFVEGARAANNADTTEDEEVTKDAPC